MSLNVAILDMYGEPMRSAVVEARARLGNDDVLCRCYEEFWSVEVDGEVVADGLTAEAAVAAVQAL